MEITLDILRIAMPKATKTNCETFLPHLNKTFIEFDINTSMRIAHFLAQLAWESGYLRYTTELAKGTAYEGRKDLGNTQEGDGVRFKGRGLIQLTGRNNYRNYLTFALGHKLIEDNGKDEVDENKELLAAPKDATRSAGWFWKNHKLNQLADNDEFTKITRIINGSSATVPKRLPCLRDAKIALGLIKIKNEKKYDENEVTSNLGFLPQYCHYEEGQLIRRYELSIKHITYVGNPLYNLFSHL